MGRVNIEVNKQLELVEVLIFLSERQEKNFQHINNVEYFSKIQSYFQKFKNHRAVTLTTELIDNKNFIHIQPFIAILCSDDILIDTENSLHEWCIAVREFEADSKFDEFFKSNNVYYSMIVEKALSCDIIKWVEYTENFFGKEFNLFNLILCPSTGNYGFVLDIPEKETAYMVHAAPYLNNNSDLIFWEDGTKQYAWDATVLAKGLAHEFGHCFVNPVVESHKEKLSDLSAFFASHKNMMQHYNVNYAVMNEYLVRAYTIKFMKEFKNIFSDFDVNEQVECQKKTFIFIEKFVEYIDEYECQNLAFDIFYLSKLEDISNLTK